MLISTEDGLADTIVPRLVLRPKSGISSEQSRDAGAYAWAHIYERLNRREEIEGGPVAAPDDLKGVQDERVEASIPR